jgi:DNA repair exonuclease SbcCD ATPase subunit
MSNFNLIDKIRGVRTKKSQSAREAYISALHGADAAAIAEASTAAGISEEAIATDLAVLERAASMRPVVEKMAGILQAKSAAQSAYDLAERRLNEAVEKLTPAAQRAGDHLLQVRDEEKLCRSAVQELDSLYINYPELLNPATLPPAIREFRESIASQGSAEHRIHAAHNRVRECEDKLAEAQKKLRYAQYGGTFYGMKTNLNPGSDEEAIKFAKAEVAATKKELDEAVSAADKVVGNKA